MKQNLWQEMWLTEVICKITVCQVKNLTVESTPLNLEKTFIIFKYSIAHQIRTLKKSSGSLRMEVFRSNSSLPSDIW